MGDLTKLHPTFAADGAVTAGNLSGLTDGSAVCAAASREKAQDLGLTLIAKIVGAAGGRYFATRITGLDQTRHFTDIANQFNPDPDESRQSSLQE